MSSHVRGWRAQRDWVGTDLGSWCGSTAEEVRWNLQTGALLLLAVQRAWLVWAVTRGLFYTWHRQLTVRSPSCPGQGSPASPKAAAPQPSPSNPCWWLQMNPQQFHAVGDGVLCCRGSHRVHFVSSESAVIEKSGLFVPSSDGLSIWTVKQQVGWGLYMEKSSCSLLKRHCHHPREEKVMHPSLAMAKIRMCANFLHFCLLLFFHFLISFSTMK